MPKRKLEVRLRSCGIYEPWEADSKSSSPTADLPSQLSPGQSAQISELLEYFHLRARQLVQSGLVDDQENEVKISLAQWQDLLDMQSQLAEYLRAIGGPGFGGVTGWNYSDGSYPEPG